MSVLVVGANGYIGFAVAQYLRQHGYKVYGLVRNKDQSHRLAIHEIIPVIGDGADPNTYKSILQHIQFVVDCSSSGNEAINNKAVLDATRSSTTITKKVYIYTSGILVHGNSSDLFLNEAQLVVPDDLKWRVNYENEIIQLKDIHGIVIRPGFVYGYAGSNGGGHLGDSVFDLSKTEGKIVIVGNKDKRTSWVHVYDLARAYLLTLQKYPIVSGEIFDIASSHAPTHEQIRRKAADLGGFKNAEIKLTPVGTGIWDKLLDISVRVSSKKASNLLGWEPYHVDVLDDLEQIRATWLALGK